MDPGDLRTSILVAGLLIGRVLRMPSLMVATVTGVMFWQGYEAGASYGAPGGLVNAQDVGVLALLGFMVVLGSVVWILMVREVRQGRTPVVRPAHVLVATAFVVVGFVAGLAGSSVFGRVPLSR